MRMLLAVLITLTALVQYRLWFADGGSRDLWRVEAAVAERRAANDKLVVRNRLLAAEVGDLKRGLEAVEERARVELGLLGEGETFYQIVDRRR